MFGDAASSRGHIYAHIHIHIYTFVCMLVYVNMSTKCKPDSGWQPQLDWIFTAVCFAWVLKFGGWCARLSRNELL